MMQAERPPILKVVSQHAEGAAFEWLLRDAAVSSAHHNLVQLSRIDERVAAHLDGLMVAGEAGWDACAEGLAWEEPGEVFAAAYVALASASGARIDRVLALASTREDLLRAFAAALGWMEWGLVTGRVHDFMESRDPQLRGLGLSAAAIHRGLSRRELERALEDEDPLVRRRAMKAVGEMGESSFLPQLRRAMLSKDEAERFQAAWSGCLLGDGSFTSELCLQALAPSADAEQACLLAMRSMKHEDSFRWLAAFSKAGGEIRVLVKGMGASGDASHVPVLLEKMVEAPLARVAGESLTFITGLDLAEAELEGNAPEGYEAGPNDDPEDENVARDPDEGLPWPLATEVASWWRSSQAGHPVDGRTFLGQPPLPDHLRSVLRGGTQRHRAASALELALREPGRILYNTSAPGFRQWSTLP
jgi:uncharacterized protein (TIGR02270 family)